MTSRERAHQAAKILAGSSDRRLVRMAIRLIKVEARMAHEDKTRWLKLVPREVA